MRRNRTASWRSRGSCAGWLRQRQRSFSSRRSPSFDNDSNSDRVSTSLRRKARRNINAVDRDKGLWKPSSTPMVGNEANTSNTLSARGGLEGTFYLQTYGCQMNVNDSEIVRGVLRNAGMRESHDEREADVVLINTCAIRDKAEQRVWQRLREFRNRKVMQGRKKKVVGVLGCMGERLKEKLVESDCLVDLVAGPDAYRALPEMLSSLQRDEVEYAINTHLSCTEMYDGIQPVRENNSVSAFTTIMRGCSNMCSFCIVPWTRGRERSRDPTSILGEIRRLSESGVREVTLLGQNVNSYHFVEKGRPSMIGGRKRARKVFDPTVSRGGFSNLYKLRGDPLPRGEDPVASMRFAELLAAVADVDKGVRIRFTSPHPKDFPPELLTVIAEKPNVCASLHLPLQSGSTRILDSMRRGYSKEAFLTLVDDARRIIPDVALSTDVIAGFCGETEEDHMDTLDVMQRVGFEQAFMFYYSMREGTHAHRRLKDDVPLATKKRRLQEIIAVFRERAQEKNSAEVAEKRRHVVLVEGKAKKNELQLTGRTDTNKRAVMAQGPLPVGEEASETKREAQQGDYVAVEVVDAGVTTLKVKPLYIKTD